MRKVALYETDLLLAVPVKFTVAIAEGFFVSTKVTVPVGFAPETAATNKTDFPISAGLGAILTKTLLTVLKEEGSNLFASKATLAPVLSKTSSIKKLSLALSRTKLLNKGAFTTGVKPLNKSVLADPSKLGIYESSYLAKLVAEAVPCTNLVLRLTELISAVALFLRARKEFTMGFTREVK